MASSMPRARAGVAVGIVAWRQQPGELARCLGALERQDGAERIVGVFVRDNAAGWSALELERWTASPDRRIPLWVEEGDNLGFGPAHNRLRAEAAKAGADAYWCLNPDALVHPGCLEAYVAAVARHGASSLFDAVTEPVPHPKGFEPGTGLTSWCSGVSLFGTMAAWDAVGGFDPALPLYAEDVDLSWRARATGLACRTVPEALVAHWAFDRPEREPAMWLGALRLAVKWREPALVRSALEELRRLGHPAGADPSSVLSGVSPVDRSLRDAAGCDFGHGLVFATPTW
jgi:N-acetylglucosaminyl-diphospho-decaprenol L-rhamnosyltransferase